MKTLHTVPDEITDWQIRAAQNLMQNFPGIRLRLIPNGMEYILADENNHWSSVYDLDYWANRRMHPNTPSPEEARERIRAQ